MATKLREFPADPETRRKAIQEKLNAEAGGDMNNKRPTVAAKKRVPAGEKSKSDFRRLLDPKESRERTVEGKSEALMERVDRAVKNAKPDRF